jgi:hypothetical protein
MMRKPSTIVTVLSMLLLAGLPGCGNRSQTAGSAGSDSLLASNPQEPAQGTLTPQQQYRPTPAPPPARTATAPSSGAPTVNVPSGTPMEVSVGTTISSETANLGDGWNGTVENPVVVDGRTVIPAGSMVHGVVSAVTPARKGDRAMLDLSLASVLVNGRSYRLHGGTEAIVAGSTRARNLGAIAGGAAAGALIGHVIGGSTKGTLIGGLLGGAAAGTAVAKSKGYQVELKAGTRLTFSTSQSLAVRR